MAYIDIERPQLLLWVKWKTQEVFEHWLAALHKDDCEEQWQKNADQLETFAIRQMRDDGGLD